MKQYLLSAALVIGLGASGFAQTVRNTYRFAQSSASYQSQRGDTVIAIAGDDNVYANISIGFPFSFNGVSHDKVAVGHNGFVAFTTKTFSGGTGQSILSASVPSGIALSNLNYGSTALPDYGPLVAGLNYDLLCDAAVGAGSELSLTRAGSAPNRQAIFQWRNYRKYGVSHTADDISFQIILNEGSGEVSVHVGPIVYTGLAAHGQVGIRGNDSTDVNSIKGNSWTQVVQNVNARDGVYSTITDAPIPNTLYTWSTAAPAALDAAVTAILKPASSFGTSCVSSITDTVRFTLRNNGTDPITTLPVSYMLNGGSPVTETFNLITPLIANASINLDFRALLTISTSGVSRLVVYSDLSGEAPATQRNDTVSKSITISSVAGSTSIYPLWTTDFGGQISSTYPAGWIGERVSGTAQWRVDSAIFDPGSSFSSPLRTVNGPGILFFPSFGSSTSGAINKVISPCLNLNNWPTNEPAWLLFGLNQDSEFPNRPDSVLVQVAVNGNTFTTVGRFSRYNATQAGYVWRNFGIDLSAYRNQTVRIAFVAISKGGMNMGIDFATILNTVPVSIAKSLEATSVEVYPNPTTALLNIKLPTNVAYNKVEVLNLLGQVVLQDNTNGISTGNLKLDLTDLPKGAYQIRVIGQTTQYQQRIVKQ